MTIAVGHTELAGGPVPVGRIRILVVDDHQVVREGFCQLLATQDDFEVIGAAGDGAEAVRQCALSRPDVVLMDVRMPGMDGIAATRLLTGATPENARDTLSSSALRRSGPRVLILTTFDLDEYVYDTLRAGASGFLLKDVTAETLFDAVRVIATGDALLAPTLTRRLISEFAFLRQQNGGAAGDLSTSGEPRPGRDDAVPALAGLTPRETQVLRLVAEGLSNAEIARRLVVSEETVKTHVSRVLAKLGLRDRTQAVVAAYETGLVVPGLHDRQP